MQIRERHSDRNELGLNLTPLIDVVFLLLLFFMVSTTFKQSTKLDLDLPMASARAPLAQATVPIEIGINAQGQYYLQKAALDSNNPTVLKKALNKILSQNASPEIWIMGDKLAPHQAVVSAMDVVGQLGVTKLKIIANTQNQLT